MPCSDVTEILTLQLDDAELVRDYALEKRSCGRAVGEKSLLLDWLAGRCAEELLGLEIDALFERFDPSEEAEEFLLLKHWFAVREALAVYLGHEDGGASSPCAMASVACGPEGTEVIVRLSVDVLTEKIRSCGRCGTGCGTKRRASSAS